MEKHQQSAIIYFEKMKLHIEHAPVANPCEGAPKLEEEHPFLQWVTVLPILCFVSNVFLEGISGRGGGVDSYGNAGCFPSGVCVENVVVGSVEVRFGVRLISMLCIVFAIDFLMVFGCVCWTICVTRCRGVCVGSFLGVVLSVLRFHRWSFYAIDIGFQGFRNDCWCFFAGDLFFVKCLRYRIVNVRGGCIGCDFVWELVFCNVDCDDDVRNMLLLAKSFRLDHMDAIIQVRDNGSGSQCGVTVSHDDGECKTMDLQTADMEDRTNLLATYCPHQTKTFLSTGCAFGSTHVGQTFLEGAHEFRTFKYVKNDAIRVTAMRKFVTSTVCGWLVHARVSPSNGIMSLKRFFSVHSYGAVVQTYRNPQTGSDLVSDVIVGRMREQPLTRSMDVVFNMKDGYGLDISYRVAWLGVEKARSEVFGDHAMSFDQLRWYSDVVMENNPHSYINLDFDEQMGRFVRYFIAFRACINGFNGCRLLPFLDSTFLKGRFNGTLLAAIAKDRNQGLFPVAFAIVDSENSSNWEWFLHHLAEVVDSSRNLTFVSDSNLGLIQSMPIVFPAAHHAFCLLHLHINLRDQMKYVNANQKVGLMWKLHECTYAPTVTSFNHKIEILKQCSPAVVGNFLQDLHPQHRANMYFRGRRYGEMWSNAAKSFNNWIREARHLPVTQLVDAIRGKIMEKMLKWKVKSSVWTGELCPKMENPLMSKFKDSRHWIVSQSNNNIFEVRSHPSVLVDIIVAFRNSGKNVYDYIESFYHVVKYRVAYEGSIHPILTVAKPKFTASDYLIVPPIFKTSSRKAQAEKNSIEGRGCSTYSLWSVWQNRS
ncbi:hypothetical protein ACSBR1_013314 [Camellia fascicularis]